MNILFVIDKIELKYFEFNNLVTNFWFIKEFLERNHKVFITTTNNLYLKDATSYSICFPSYLENENIFYNKTTQDININEFDLVMFRPDPPVDNDYINATYILDFVTDTKIVNNTKSIRNFNEKLHTAIFSEYMPKHIVTASKNKIEEFLNEHNEIILKPLNKCFGRGVMYLHKNDPNTRSIINTMTNEETSVCMVQKFIPNVRFGDKRVLTLGDTVMDECVIKLPTSDDFKFNTHDDKYIKKGLLTETEKINFTKVAQKLNDMGIYMAGLDVVDEQIIEINVTSPCYFIKEINNNFCTNICPGICDYILSLTNSKNSLQKQDNYLFKTEII